MRTTITAFLAALILPGLSMAAADEAKTITATHTLGTVELPVNPKRVAVLDYGSLETISELGVTPALALPKKFLPPYLSKFSGEQYTDLGTVKEFNIETINAFKPDLIIISGRQQDYYQKLSSIAPVYLVDILAKDQLGEAKKNIRLLGDVFGLAGLLELVEPDLLQHAPFLGLDLVAGDAAVGHEPLRCVAHRSVSFPYRSSSHTR